MEPQPGSPPFSPGKTLWDNNNATAATPSEDMAAPDEAKEEATELEPARKSSSSSSSSADIPCDIDVADLVNPLAAAAALPEDEQHGAGAKASTPEDERAGPDEHGGEAKPEDGVQAAPAPAAAEAVDDSFASSSDGGGAAKPEASPPPQVPTASPANLGAAAASNGFDPGRIPASVFQHRPSVSQAEWSMASNESLFSIQGAGDMYPGASRSHFDFFYDEAMAAEASAAPDAKLPSLAEGAEPESAAGAGRGNDDAGKRAAVFRRHESGSGGSSSNFSFAFPILAETSPRKKDLVSSALYRPPEKEREPPPVVPVPVPPQTQLEPPVSAFMEMTTEEERRRSDDAGCCCCGCCWFDCSWCCRWPWWRCGCCCCCSCPSLCRCSWCLCS